MLQEWGSKINWEKRVKAVCKPCWELKYCPYGPLVEEFPLLEVSNNQSCRIFGHQCPVFSVAEPLTETKKLRNISRNIPRTIQFRVLKRDNQICRRCSQPVLAEDIHFDHVIPWSKGGPTEETNIQLLCGKCNQEKANQFEQEHLVSSVRDHLAEPIGSEIIEFLLFAAEFRHAFFKEHNRLPNVSEFAKEFSEGEVSESETQVISTIRDLEELFLGVRPTEVGKKIFSALRLRWGYSDGSIRNIQETARETCILAEEIMMGEISLVERLGWRVNQSKKELRKWLQT